MAKQLNGDGESLQLTTMPGEAPTTAPNGDKAKETVNLIIEIINKDTAAVTAKIDAETTTALNKIEDAKQLSLKQIRDSFAAARDTLRTAEIEALTTTHNELQSELRSLLA